MSRPQLLPPQAGHVHTHSLDEDHYTEVDYNLTGDDFPGFCDSVYEQPVSDTEERKTRSDTTPLGPPPVLMPRGVNASRKPPAIPDTTPVSHTYTRLTKSRASKNAKNLQLRTTVPSKISDTHAKVNLEVVTPEKKSDATDRRFTLQSRSRSGLVKLTDKNNVDDMTSESVCDNILTSNTTSTRDKDGVIHTQRNSHRVPIQNITSVDRKQSTMTKVLCVMTAIAVIVSMISLSIAVSQKGTCSCSTISPGSVESPISASAMSLNPFERTLELITQRVQVLEANASDATNRFKSDSIQTEQSAVRLQSINTSVSNLAHKHDLTIAQTEQNISELVNSLQVVNNSLQSLLDFVDTEQEYTYAQLVSAYNAFITNLDAAAACEGGIRNVSSSGHVQCAASQVAAGAIVHFAVRTAPPGYHVCDGMPRSMWVVMSRFALPASGSLLQVSEYMSLFIAIGRTYGGASGAGTFRLPDLMTGNRYMRAAGGTLDVGTIEDDATAINGVRVATSDPGHSHGVSDAGHSHGINDPGHNHNDGIFDSLLRYDGRYTNREFDDSAWEPNLQRRGTIQRSTTGISVRSSSSGISVNTGTTGVTTSISSFDTETRPRSIAMLPCIKL